MELALKTVNRELHRLVVSKPLDQTSNWSASTVIANAQLLKIGTAIQTHCSSHSMIRVIVAALGDCRLDYTATTAFAVQEFAIEAV